MPDLALGSELPIVWGADVFFPLQGPGVAVLFVTHDAERSAGIQKMTRALGLHPTHCIPGHLLSRLRPI